MQRTTLKAKPRPTFDDYSTLSLARRRLALHLLRPNLTVNPVQRIQVTRNPVLLSPNPARKMSFLNRLLSPKSPARSPVPLLPTRNSSRRSPKVFPMTETRRRKMAMPSQLWCVLRRGSGSSMIFSPFLIWLLPSNVSFFSSINLLIFFVPNLYAILF